AGAELLATLIVTRRDGAVHESLSAARTRHVAAPQWKQSLAFYVDTAKHADMILRLVLVLSDGAEQTWGLLRLPLAEVVSHGEHQGWFFLSDDAGDPLRNHRGDAARVYLAFQVHERVAARLERQLADAQAEIAYLKGDHVSELRQQLDECRRDKRLLEATVGDLQVEFRAAKAALVDAGAGTHLALIAQVEDLHVQLRAAWVAQQHLANAPNARQKQYDDELKAEIARLSRPGGPLDTPSSAPATRSEFGDGKVTHTQEHATRGVPSFIPTPLSYLEPPSARCSSYCTLLFGTAKKQTSVSHGNSNPSFQEAFTFQAGSTPGDLLVTVLHRETAAHDEYIGTASISISRVANTPGKATDEWYLLRQ
ncbi:hypothetical protein T484DRAFT_1923754, partial [Baffinella frigidus]